MPTATTSDAALEAQVFWFRYRKEIAGLLVLVLVAVLSFAIWRIYRERHEAAASAAFAAAKTASDYETVIDRYGNTPAAASALLLLADAQRRSGNLTDANATLQRFIDKFPRHELVSTAHMSMAANLQAMGKSDEAAAAFQQVAAVDPGSFSAPLALLAQAQILQDKGKADDARRVCETIMSQYQQSYAAAEAAQLLRTLKPAASASPPGMPQPVSPVSSPRP
jgi:TolA-binding protein